MNAKQEWELSEQEIERRSAATLKRLLATPPDHRRKVNLDANPKKRGRPPKASREPSGGGAPAL
jgi:hypothetical protein